MRVKTTDKFKEDLNQWLSECIDDGYSLPFERFETLYKLETIESFTQTAIDLFRVAVSSEEEVSTLRIRDKYRTSKYREMVLTNEHFEIVIYNPFTKESTPIKM